MERLMKLHLMSSALLAGLLLAPTASTGAVEYVKICSLYGAGFHYIPGTDTCVNEATGDARVQTEGGTWRSLLPYPEGKWVVSPVLECLPGRLVTLGTFSSKDFFPNVWNRKQTRAIPVPVNRGEFVSKVFMGGGFMDPRIPNRRGTNGTDGLCVRSVDPGVYETHGGETGAVNPPFGNGMLPIGCVANSRIANMPAAYAISATAAYPNIDAFYLDSSQQSVSGPYTYGSRLVVTTDFGGASMQELTYFDARSGSNRPLAGSVSVSVCIHPGALR
jgi:hypothetical protein